MHARLLAVVARALGVGFAGAVPAHLGVEDLGATQQLDVARRHDRRVHRGPACRGRSVRVILGWMLASVVLVILGPLVVAAALVGSGALRVHRYSPAHVDGRLAVGGRGLFFSRTPDGLWWRLRLRPCRRLLEDRSGWDEPRPDGGVREPRRPLGPPPRADEIALDEPGR